MTKIGKDKEGKYHPPKGSPSGKNKKKAVVDSDTIAGNLEDNGDAIPDNVRVRHPNRHAGKRDRVSKKNTIEVAKNSTLVSSAASPADKTADVEEIKDVKLEFLKELSTKSFPVCISIYLPTHTGGVEVNQRQDFIGFKNILQRVTSELKTKAMDENAIQVLLAPAFDLLKNDAFWNNLSQGLSVFIGKDYFRLYRMPFSPAESVTVNSSFTIKPLLNVLASPEYFYILVISKKQSLFYKADAFRIEPIPVPELPDGIYDVVHFE